MDILMKIERKEYLGMKNQINTLTKENAILKAELEKAIAERDFEAAKAAKSEKQKLKKEASNL